MANNEIVGVFYEFLEKITVSEKSKWKKFLTEIISCDDLKFHLSFDHSDKNTNVVLSLTVDKNSFLKFPTEKDINYITNELDEIRIIDYIYDHFQSNLYFESYHKKRDFVYKEYIINSRTMYSYFISDYYNNG